MSTLQRVSQNIHEKLKNFERKKLMKNITGTKKEKKSTISHCHTNENQREKEIMLEKKTIREMDKMMKYKLCLVKPFKKPTAIFIKE